LGCGGSVCCSVGSLVRGLTGWDARAALLLWAERLVVVGVAVLGLATGGIRWDGLAMMMDGYGWACGQDLAALSGVAGWMNLRV